MLLFAGNFLLPLLLQKTVDLYEAQNLGAVQVTMYKLSAVAQKKGYDGPAIGVKIADENVRDFDQQKLREGRNVIGLQVRLSCFQGRTTDSSRSPVTSHLPKSVVDLSVQQSTEPSVENRKN